jgi:uncharacterized protein
LVALLDVTDQHHKACQAASHHFTERIATVWPVVCEAMYLLSGVSLGQEKLLEMIEQNVLHFYPIDGMDLPRIRELMRKYAGRHMDFADASLVRVAERKNIQKIFTVDRKDFSVYRLHNKIKPILIP